MNPKFDSYAKNDHICEIGRFFISDTIESMNCEICQALKHPVKSTTITTTSRWRVDLSPDQQNLGKCWITLIDHKKKLSELDNTDWV